MQVCINVSILCNFFLCATNTQSNGYVHMSAVYSSMWAVCISNWFRKAHCILMCEIPVWTTWNVKIYRIESSWEQKRHKMHKSTALWNKYQVILKALSVSKQKKFVHMFNASWFSIASQFELNGITMANWIFNKWVKVSMSRCSGDWQCIFNAVIELLMMMLANGFKSGRTPW